MKTKHCFALVVLSLWPLSESLSQYDLLPLQAGRTWFYQFNSRERFGALGIYRWQKTSSGTLRLKVLKDSTAGMTTHWTVESSESLSVRREDLYPFPGDTVYVTTSTDTFAIVEDLTGNHLLLSDSCSGPWLFPRRWYSPYHGAIPGTGSAVSRYSSDHAADTLHSSMSSLPYALADTIILARDMGVAWTSASIVRGSNSPYEYFWNATLLGGPVGLSSGERGQTPASFELFPCYPNPFNPTTVVSFHLPAGQAGLPVASHVKLAVYDRLGREVSVLVDGPREAGHHVATFDAVGLASGLYLCRLESVGFRQTIRLLLLK